MASASSAPGWSDVGGSAAGSRASVYASASGLASSALQQRPCLVTFGDPFMRFAVSLTKIDKTTFYQIDTQIVQGEGAGQQLSVYRRYADFEWLRSVLAEEFTGVVIPPTPDSSLVDRLSSTFEDQRVAGLQLFLEKIADHHQLRSSPNLRHFISDSADLFSETVLRAKALTESRKRSTKSSFLMGLKKIKGVFSKPGEGDPLRLSGKEQSTIEYMEAVGKDLHHLSQVCSKLAKGKHAMAESMTSVADGFKSFGIHESDDTTKRLWLELDRVTGAMGKDMEATAFSLDRNVGDVADFFDRSTGSFVDWIKSRPEAQQLYDFSSADLADAITKRQKTDSAKKINALDEEIKKHETCLEFQKSRFEGVLENLTAEYRRFIREKVWATANALSLSGRDETDSADQMIEQCNRLLEMIRGSPTAEQRPSTVTGSSDARASLRVGGSSASASGIGGLGRADEPLSI